MRSILVPFLLVPLLLQAQVRMPTTTRADMAWIEQQARIHADAADLNRALEGSLPSIYRHGRCMIGLLGMVGPDFVMDPAHPHIDWGARKGDIISFRIDARHILEVEGIPGAYYVELAGKAVPTLDRLLKAVRADSVQLGIHLPQPYTGKDVLIGFTDWGFDLTHPMFYDTSLTQTRIRAAWDQYRDAGPSPNGFGYGTEAATVDELLAMGSDTANIYSYATHGTHVAGIAAGSGAGTAYRGVAFESGLLFCTILVDAAAVMDAFLWMQQIAEMDQKRLVINMSWGLYHIGTLDGNSLISQVIDQMSQEGVVFVNSGGNNGDVDFHIRKQFAGDTIRSRIQFYPYSAHPHMWGQSISMWGQPEKTFSAGFMIMDNQNNLLMETPWYNTATAPVYLDSVLIIGADTIQFNLTAEDAHPLNQRPHFRLRVRNVHGQYSVGLKASAHDGVVHFWNVTELSNDVGNWGQAFQAPVQGWTAGDKAYGISEPACTESLITVAAYSSEFFSSSGFPLGGSIAPFSSFGPTLDERMKPDIAAPGVGVTSAASSFTDLAFVPSPTISFQGGTYGFTTFSGTSMSAPAVAGVVALILEADPTLTPAEVKAIIHSTARTDQHTGLIPPGGDTRWGHGKVNAYHAVTELLNITAVPEHEAQEMLILPMPVRDRFMVVQPFGGSTQLTVQDLAGRTIASRTVQGDRIHMDAGAWAPGLYVLRLQQGDRVLSGKLVKE